MRRSILGNYFYQFLLIFQLTIGSSNSYAQVFCKDIFNTEQNKIFTFTTFVKNYSEIIPMVRSMIEIGLERYSSRNPKGNCYRAVKELLIDSDMVRRAIDGTFASSAHTKNFLVNRGFINLLERAPFDNLIKGPLDINIPIGAILVYAGTNGIDGTERPLGYGVGHIEIKCGPNCYLFDSVKEFPGGSNQFTSSNIFEAGEGITLRRLIGVYVLDFFSLF